MTVFSRSDAKKADALEMGATRFIATGTPGWEKDLERDLDLIICTASSSSLPIDELLSTLDVECKLIFMGLPEEGIKSIKTQSMCGNAAFLGSSHLGNRAEMQSMLKLAAEKQIKPWIQVMQMKDAAKAIKAVEDGSVRYRSILVQVSGFGCRLHRTSTDLIGYQRLSRPKVESSTVQHTSMYRKQFMHYI
jgi:alcohol dehydrogenase (NADP+)